MQQLQKVTDTYKREVSEQQARQAEIEDQLAAAQGELAAAQAQAEVSQKALENLKSHPPPVGSQPDGAMLLVLSARLPTVQLQAVQRQRLLDVRRQPDLLLSTPIHMPGPGLSGGCCAVQCWQEGRAACAFYWCWDGVCQGRDQADTAKICWQ